MAGHALPHRMEQLARDGFEEYVNATVACRALQVGGEGIVA